MNEEQVLVIPRSVLAEVMDLSQEYWKGELAQLDLVQPHFMLRMEAECDFENKQLIPYALFRNAQGRFLSYKRCGSEKRLRGLRSIGIGGHVNLHDKQDTISKTLVAGLVREIKEELKVDLPADDIHFLGYINEERTEAGRCHIGIVFVVDTNGRKLTFDDEISDPKWTDVDAMHTERYEFWSELALNLVDL